MLTFAIIKKNSPPNSMEGHPEFLGYSSLQEFVYGPKHQLIRYMVFRFGPPALIGILICGVMNRVHPGMSSFPALIMVLLVSNVSGSIKKLFTRKTWLRERLAHSLVLSFLTVLSIIISASLDGTPLIIRLTPSLSGFVDNAWSTLLVAVLIAGFIRLTQRSSKDRNQSDTSLIQHEIREAYRGIDDKFGHLVRAYPAQDPYVKEAFLCILTFENMNRPKWWRRVENLLVRLPNVRLTVGIAQISSDRPLTDDESIQVGVAHLAEVSNQLEMGTSIPPAAGPQHIERLIRAYNPNESYVTEVMSIWQVTSGLRG